MPKLEKPIHAVEIPWPAVRPRYVVTVGLRDTGTEFECVSFAVAVQDGGTVNSLIVRSLPVGQLIHEAIQRLLRELLARTHVERTTPLSEEELQEVVDPEHERVLDAADRENVESRRDEYLAEREARLAALRQAGTGQRTGRRYGSGHLEIVAELVAEARREHKPIAAAVAEAFGTSKSAAGNMIGRARAQGLID